MKPTLTALLASMALIAAFFVLWKAEAYYRCSRESQKIRSASGVASLDSMNEEMEYLNAVTSKLKQQGTLGNDSHAEAIRSARDRAAKSDTGLSAVKLREIADRATAERNQLALEFLLACVWLAVSLCGLAVVGGK